MATETHDKSVHMRDDDSAWISVQNPMYVDLDDQRASTPPLHIYVEAKLNAVAPWLARSSAYQSVFQEACQLCQSGYDFNRARILVGGGLA